jgi:hypothetical protein
MNADGEHCIRNDETERGWQAKYVFEWDDSLASQLNKSIEAALKKHPKLTEYVVCLPFNLPDARQKNRKSQRERWNTWKAKWEGNAKKDGRSLEIELWDATALTTRLNVDRPELSGRRYYWFNETELTPEWFKGVFERARADLGSRYTPETNIELPIRAAFSGCAREPRLNKVLQRWAVDIADDGHFAFCKRPTKGPQKCLERPRTGGTIRNDPKAKPLGFLRFL